MVQQAFLSALLSTPISQVGLDAISAFNQSVGGRLNLGVPWPKPCFSVYNNASVTPDTEACAAVQKDYFGHHMARSEVFSGYAASQFEGCMSTGDECLLDFTNPSNEKIYEAPQHCKQGSIPPFYVDVKSHEDVQHAFKFVEEHGVTLVIKNTGHDFKGRSSGPDSLALWMHNLKDLCYDTKFVPEGCEAQPQPAINVAAGVQFGELYQFADDQGMEIVGGTDISVGPSGGFLQGGGHSPVANTLGMGADRVLQYKVVTPDGILRYANACQNTDLFYALRGGGGGTYGVVMESTILASPRRPYDVATITWPVNDENLRKVMEMFIDNVTALATQGWGGNLTPTMGNLVLIIPSEIPDSRETVQPLLDLSAALGGKPELIKMESWNEYFALYASYKLAVQQCAVGLPTAMTSRLVPEVNHRTPESRKELVDAVMLSFTSTIFPQIHFTTAFGYRGTDGSDTGTSSLFRTTLYQIIWVNTWLPGAKLSDRQAAYDASTKAASYVRDITPEGGAYVNESDIHEPNWRESFWGSKYQKLLAIKAKYDPKRLLDCWHCVGWQGKKAPRYKCYI
ncbi:FAD-binding domain-containing protein [Crepidotus variabilis]|uniref:FAD-binding domain-containing protein n=1 Tax=Crepidotus variabilis TaxID=179855 RepID=A0A9P6EQE4_9AGAR|nr:FAD-binding domain-containing protein [Crepidotus variabilis]